MKRSILTLSLTLLLSAFFANLAFAAAHIPGISVIIFRNPGGITVTSQTGNNGKTSFKLAQGNYDLTISYAEIMKVINRLEKNKVNKGGYTIILSTEQGSVPLSVNGRPNDKITISKETGNINLNIPKGGGIVKLMLTYEFHRAVDATGRPSR